MMLIDTHTHLYLDDFSSEESAVVERAISAGVQKLVFPNVDISTVEPMRKLHDCFPDNIFMAMGLHPTEVDGAWGDTLGVVEKELIKHRNDYIAIGEIGIDLYWDKTYKDQQMEVFSIQVEWANKYNLPIIIHCREGLSEVLEVLKNASSVPTGVFHSLGGTIEDVEAIRSIGDFYFGINGIVTFKNSKLKNVLPAIGADRILLETDSPYLAPVPYRGKRNVSAYIVKTAQTVSEALDIPFEKVAELTSENAERLFKLNNNL